ncbi:myosin-11-like, partial [Diaphorina citri]|uniref:Myosin-11-like n=1 Tax=Diaphorina citri TaxID=121845 RepID=A0A3Q0IU79_DIACI
MDQVSQAPTKKILKRRLNETSVSRTPSPTSLKQNTTVSMMNETVELDDAVSVSGESTYTSEEPLAGRQSIAACLQDIDSGLVGHTKRRDDLLVSIRNKKEELREKNERTAELRNKNEEISLMIQAEDKDMSVITDNSTKELDTFRFFETQVLSSREHIQKLKREVNRNKMKQAENMNLVKSGMESLGRLKAELEAGLAAKERECKFEGTVSPVVTRLLAVQKVRVRIPPSTKICTPFLVAHIATGYFQVLSSSGLSTLYCEMCKLNYRQLKSEHMRSERHKKMREFLIPICKVSNLRDRVSNLRDRVSSTCPLEVSGLTPVKKSPLLIRILGFLGVKLQILHSQDGSSFPSSHEEETDAKNLELEQAKSRLFAGRQTLSLKQTQLDQSKSEVEELSRTLDEKEARRGQLEREIEEKRREGERRLEVLMEEMEGKCQREMQALEEELEERKKEVEAKIEQIEKDTAMLQQEQEHHLLSHTATMETLHQEQATWCVKTNAAQNELNEFQLNMELLRTKLASLQQTSDEERDKLRGEMDRMRGEMEEKGRQRQEEVEGALDDKKGVEKAKFKAQYEKLVAMYENVAKASRDAADELMVHRNARERIVQGLQGLMKEK